MSQPTYPYVEARAPVVHDADVASEAPAGTAMSWTFRFAEVLELGRGSGEANG